MYNIIIIQRELSGGRKHSGRAPSDSGSRHSSAASSSTAHHIDSGSHMSVKDRIVSADSGEWLNMIMILDTVFGVVNV